MTEFTKNVIDIIKGIPVGKVMTYGGIAKSAGNPRGARQVSRILHSMSKTHDLPWHRIINSKGEISLTGEGLELQKKLLEEEGVEIHQNNKVNLKKYDYEVIICDDLDWI
ncbi:MGMT family protein [Oceanirhabdus sp. W0125-5]|uniref:MGMT family protein n=1 Tax=Oceanirhabdus sp. W0125-5 TaxID=2999116 RepID=UPI0022F32C11|nr:MGMT family protein [Oceanirhabdus sp. W0125-5]WBW96782.1 MGMT family protein [Oceanirhabdus sp. W0125-5]